MELRRRAGKEEQSFDDLMQDFDRHGRYSEIYAGRPADVLTLQESREVRDLVRRSIDRLPDHFRTTLVLRDIEGFTTQEVAELTKTTEQNVKVRLHRARLALRNLLKPVLRESEL